MKDLLEALQPKANQAISLTAQQAKECLDWLIAVENLKQLCENGDPVRITQYEDEGWEIERNGSSIVANDLESLLNDGVVYLE